jgi:cytochrome b561
MTAPHSRFPVLSRVLHWLMAAMILGALFLGTGMAATVSERYRYLVAIHRPLGLAILILAAIRLINRLVSPPPPLPDSIPPLQRLAAKASHVLLYALMFIIPLLGWGMLSAAPYPVVIYGSLRLPPILPQNPALYPWLRELHGDFAYALFAVFLVHLGAALLHALIRRDGVFESMTAWGRRRGAE